MRQTIALALGFTVGFSALPSVAADLSTVDSLIELERSMKREASQGNYAIAIAKNRDC